IGEKPTGSGDPYALRRAALGVIRIARETGLRLSLGPILDAAIEACYQDQRRPIPSRRQALSAGRDPINMVAIEIIEFLGERLRVQLRAEGARHDVLAAVLGAGADDDITRLLARTAAVTDFLTTEDGSNLLVAYRRAVNILRIEERRDSASFDEPFDAALLAEPTEHELARTLDTMSIAIKSQLRSEGFREAMTEMARLRRPLDRFFDHVTVNAPEPELRRNRLRLLAAVRGIMNEVADFSKIEG
ncbi:MAG TPA: glycine--tRNA ligase subunit beta, partial [Acetobacteraceae bacterium]|nr:glycine--tRNA ligase subunit beta [Acetobacteraceae bacterium]